MIPHTSQDIQKFLVGRYKDMTLNLGLDPAAISPDFDFLERGIIDSLGVLEMITAIEQNFGITVDLEGLDAADLDGFGTPLRSHYPTGFAGQDCRNPSGTRRGRSSVEEGGGD